MEGGSRFETKYFNPGKKTEPPKTPQEKLRYEIRNEIEMTLLNTQDALSYEIAQKILEKLDIKDRIDDIQKHKDNPAVYQPWKQLGLFIVVDHTSRIDWKDEESGFEIKKGDKILDIHLPPVPEGENTLTNVTHSMQLIAEYIVQQHLNIKYLVGVTFEKLARVSRRQGFTVIEPEIPTDIKRGIENVYRRFNSPNVNTESMGKILLCYQHKNQFLQRYSPRPR